MLVLFSRRRRTINRRGRNRKSQYSLLDDEELHAFVRAMRANHDGVMANMHLSMTQVVRMFDPLHADQDDA